MLQRLAYLCVRFGTLQPQNKACCQILLCSQVAVDDYARVDDRGYSDPAVAVGSDKQTEVI